MNLDSRLAIAAPQRTVARSPDSTSPSARDRWKKCGGLAKSVDYVRRLAREKAEAAWERAGEIVLGADTMVVAGEQVLEKPRDADDARSMLAVLSGRTHTVITGICLRHAAGAIVDAESTQVHFVDADR